METQAPIDVDYELARGELADVLPFLAEMPDEIKNEEEFWAWNKRFDVGFLRMRGICAEDERYRLFGLKIGGLCEVHPAEDMKTKKIVVHRRLKGYLADDDPWYRRMFRAEIDTLKKLRGHPRWVQIIDRISETETVMELVIGIPLHTLINKWRAHDASGQGLSLQKRMHLAALIGREAAEGLEPIHAQGQIIRDISPSNMIVGRKGLTLIDLNLVGRDGEASGDFAGKFNYLSPEAAMGNRQTAPSDLYSLGSVLFEIIMGHAPLFTNTEDDPDEIELLTRARRNKVRIDLLPAHSPISDTIKELLAESRHHRPQTAVKLMKLLLPFVGAPRKYEWQPDMSLLPGEVDHDVLSISKGARGMLNELLRRLLSNAE